MLPDNLDDQIVELGWTYPQNDRFWISTAFWRSKLKNVINFGAKMVVKSPAIPAYNWSRFLFLGFAHKKILPFYSSQKEYHVQRNFVTGSHKKSKFWLVRIQQIEMLHIFVPNLLSFFLSFQLKKCFFFQQNVGPFSVMVANKVLHFQKWHFWWKFGSQGVN